MWFNDWVDVKKIQDQDQNPQLVLYLSYRNDDQVFGPIITSYPVNSPSGKFQINNSVLTNQQAGVFHSYPTVFMNQAQVKDLSNLLVNRFGKDKVSLSDARGGVLQIHNISHGDFVSLDKAARAYFVPGHYKEQARWQLGWPLRKVHLDSVFEEASCMMQAINEAYQPLFEVKKGKRKRMPEWTKAEAGRQSLTDLLKKLDPGNEARVNEKTKQLNIYLASLAGITCLPQQLSTAEFLELPWCFIDTEKKFFAYPEAQNCHVALLFKLADGSVHGEVHTTEYAGVTTVEAMVNGTRSVFHMVYHQSDLAMVQGAAASISRKNPAVLCGHNIPYDIKELRGVKASRSHNGFPVGLEGADPRTAVSIDFFKRIDCSGKMIVDTLRLARILDPYLPSFGLEVVAGIDKAITYQKFDALARRADPQSALELATYVAHDVLALYHHVFVGHWKGRFAPVIKAARALGVSVSESSHSPSCAEKIRDRLFLVQQGTYRNAKDRKAIMVRMDQTFKKAWPNIKERFFDPIFSMAPPGRYEHVHRLYLPLEKAMLLYTSVHVDDLDELVEGWTRRSSLDALTVAQYLKGLHHEEWLHWYYVRKHEGDAHDLQSQFVRSYSGDPRSLLDSIKISKEGFESLSENFWIEYPKNARMKNRLANDALMKQAFGGSALLCDAKKLCDAVLHFRQAAKRFKDRHFWSVDQWDRQALQYGSAVAESIRESGAAVIARKGQWLYLSGPLPLSTSQAPIIPIDEVTILKILHKGDVRIVFKDHGGYHGARLNLKQPSSLTVFEAASIAQIIDALLDGDQGKAVDIYEDRQRMLTQGGVALQDLLFAIQKEKFLFSGMDKVHGDQVFSYEERDNGLNGFRPDLAFYKRRFSQEVGRWRFVIQTGRLKSVI